MRFKKLGLVISLSAILSLIACGNDGSKNESASQTPAKQDIAASAAEKSSQDSKLDSLININFPDCDTNGKITKQKFFGQDAEFLCQNGSWYLQTDLKGIIQKLSRDTLNNILSDLKITENELYAVIDALKTMGKSKQQPEERMITNFDVSCSAKKSDNEWHYVMHMNMAGQPSTTTVSYKFEGKGYIRTETTQVDFGSLESCKTAISNFEQSNEDNATVDTKCDNKGVLTSTISSKNDKIDEATKDEIYQEVTGICEEYQKGTITIEE